jgi:hypothetical protein
VFRRGHLLLLRSFSVVRTARVSLWTLHEQPRHHSCTPYDVGVSPWEAIRAQPHSVSGSRCRPRSGASLPSADPLQMVEVINLCDSDEELDVVRVSPDTNDKEEEKEKEEQVAPAAAPARGVKRALEATLEVSEDEVSDGAATQAPRLRALSWHPPPPTARELPLLQSPPPANTTVLVAAPVATTPRLPLIAAKTLQLRRATPPTAEPSQSVAAQLQLALAHPGEPWGTQRQREAQWPVCAARRGRRPAAGPPAAPMPSDIAPSPFCTRRRTASNAAGEEPSAGGDLQPVAG